MGEARNYRAVVVQRPVLVYVFVFLAGYFHESLSRKRSRSRGRRGSMMPGQQNDDVELKVGYMVKRSQGKSALGATNFKKRVFCLTPSRFSYYDGTVEVSVLYSHPCRTLCTHVSTTRACVSAQYYDLRRFVCSR